jgi:hypothetical protein
MCIYVFFLCSFFKLSFQFLYLLQLLRKNLSRFLFNFHILLQFYCRFYLCFLHFNNFLQQSEDTIPFYSKTASVFTSTLPKLLPDFLESSPYCLVGIFHTSSASWDHTCWSCVIGCHEVILLTPVGGRGNIPHPLVVAAESLLIFGPVRVLYFIL